MCYTRQHGTCESSLVWNVVSRWIRVTRCERSFGGELLLAKYLNFPRQEYVCLAAVRYIRQDGTCVSSLVWNVVSRCIRVTRCERSFGRKLLLAKYLNFPRQEYVCLVPVCYTRKPATCVRSSVWNVVSRWIRITRCERVFGGELLLAKYLNFPRQE